MRISHEGEIDDRRQSFETVDESSWVDRRASADLSRHVPTCTIWSTSRFNPTDHRALSAIAANIRDVEDLLALPVAVVGGLTIWELIEKREMITEGEF